MNWILLGVIVFLVIMAIVGAVVGFSRMMISLLSVVIAIALTWLVTPSVKNLLTSTTQIDESISGKIGEAVDNAVAETGSVDAYLESLTLPEKIKLGIREQFIGKTPEEQREIAVTFITDILITIIVGLVLFIVFMILITLLGKLLNLVNRLPGFKQLNHILGLVLGLAFGIVIVELLFLMLPLLSSTSVGQYVLGEISRSKFLTWAYDNNFLVTLFYFVKNRLFG